MVMLCMGKLAKLIFNEKVFRVALVEADKTQKQVAEECGISETTITRIKKGMDAHLSMAMKISRALNKNIEDFWTLPG